LSRHSGKRAGLAYIGRRVQPNNTWDYLYRENNNNIVKSAIGRRVHRCYCIFVWKRAQNV
jgi:hypothetical protein